MSYEPVLGIDLGASYTKISLRCKQARPNAEVMFARFLGRVPTLGIRDSSRGKDLWVFGDEAANLNPGPKAKVYENWKAKLSLKESGLSTPKLRM